MKDLLLFNEIIKTESIQNENIKEELLEKIKEIEEMVFSRNYLTQQFIYIFYRFYKEVNNNMINTDEFKHLNLYETDNEGLINISMNDGINIISINNNYDALDGGFMYVESEEEEKRYFSTKLTITASIAATKLSNLIFLYLRTYVETNSNRGII